MNVIFAPNILFTERQQPATRDANLFTAADPHILRAVAVGPQPLMTVLNSVVRQLPYHSKREKLAVGRAVLKRMGELVRAGRLRRVRRTCLMRV